MTLQTINNHIEKVGHVCSMVYCSILVSLVLSGLLTVAMIWHVCKLLNEIWNEGIFSTLIDKTVGIITR